MIRIIVVAAAAAVSALVGTGTAPAAAQSSGPQSSASQVTGALTPSGAPMGRPILRRSVTVTSDVVRIGDLVDNAGDTAAVAIFRSPDVGTTGAVPTRKIIEAARANNLFGIDSGDVVEVSVTRAGRTVERKEVEDRIARLFAGTNGLGLAQDLVVSFDRELPAITTDLPAGRDLRVARSTFDPAGGRFDVILEIPVGGSRRSLMRFAGAVVETAETVVLTRSIARGEVVRSADVVVERRAKSGVPADAALTPGEVVGRAARQPLRQGQPLRRIDLMKPEIVKRDETVTLIYHVPGITLTTRGKALETGGEGDLINVLNPQSNRTVQGVITGPGKVDIATPTSRAATAPPADPADAPAGRTQ